LGYYSSASEYKQYRVKPIVDAVKDLGNSFMSFIYSFKNLKYKVSTKEAITNVSLKALMVETKIQQQAQHWILMNVTGVVEIWEVSLGYRR
jgi:uncharacterized protein YoxC